MLRNVINVRFVHVPLIYIGYAISIVVLSLPTENAWQKIQYVGVGGSRAG